MRKLVEKLNHFLHYLSAFFILALMFMTLAEIVMRRFLNMPLAGTFELTMMFLSLAVFFGCGFAQQNGMHVVIDFLYERLPRRWRRVLSVLSTVLFAAISVLMFWTVFQDAIRRVGTGDVTSTLQLPFYPFVFASALGLLGLLLAVLCTLYYVVVEKGVLGE
ncbi:MAG: TRAP transporter small permease [Oscillospiraceae bacterium]|nr:TRAP transporter small permease [Oscillospiraceae bacterium]